MPDPCCSTYTAAPFTSIQRTESKVGARDCNLQVTNDRALKTGRQQPWSEGAGGILTDGREQPQRGLDRRGHVAQLPTDLFSNIDALVGRGQSRGLRGVRGGAQGVRSHVGDGRGLPRASGGSGGGRSLHVTSGAAADESSADLAGDIELATRKGSRPSDCIPGAGVVWSFRLEQPQHPLGAGRGPRRDDPPVAFAQRLRRAHSEILAALTMRQRACAPRRRAADDRARDRGRLGNVDARLDAGLLYRTRCPVAPLVALPLC